MMALRSVRARSVPTPTSGLGSRRIAAPSLSRPISRPATTMVLDVKVRAAPGHGPFCSVCAQLDQQ